MTTDRILPDVNIPGIGKMLVELEGIHPESDLERNAMFNQHSIGREDEKFFLVIGAGRFLNVS